MRNTKTLTISFVFILFLYGCGSSLKTSYKNGEEAWNSVKDVKYSDIVKVWGEPDDRSPEGDHVDITWSDAKVHIQEGGDGEIVLSFDKSYDAVYNKFQGIGEPHDLVCGDWQYYSDHKVRVYKVK